MFSVTLLHLYDTLIVKMRQFEVCMKPKLFRMNRRSQINYLSHAVSAIFVVQFRANLHDFYFNFIPREKCTNEHEQMYCRSGCKCEQQYRLHRLLAYNPLDACRGIFSDWFRFPSCCICKCYDIPFDYRVTSRSPRSEKVLKLKDEDDDIEAFPIFEDDNNFFDPE